MEVTKSAVGTVVVWCIFCNCFSTDIYKDVILLDAQKLEAKERDIQCQEITFNYCITFNTKVTFTIQEYIVIKLVTKTVHIFMVMEVQVSSCECIYSQALVR